MAAISTGTSPLYTAQNPGWNYEAIAYDANELPQPLPARNDLLPWERKERTEQQRYDKQATETQRAYDDAARQKGTRGWRSNSLYSHSSPHSSRWLLQQPLGLDEAALCQVAHHPDARP